MTENMSSLRVFNCFRHVKRIPVIPFRTHSAQLVLCERQSLTILSERRFFCWSTDMRNFRFRILNSGFRPLWGLPFHVSRSVFFFGGTHEPWYTTHESTLIVLYILLFTSPGCMEGWRRKAVVHRLLYGGFEMLATVLMWEICEIQTEFLFDWKQSSDY